MTDSCFFIRKLFLSIMNGSLLEVTEIQPLRFEALSLHCCITQPHPPCMAVASNFKFMKNHMNDKPTWYNKW